MSYQPKWEVRDRYNDTVKSPGVVLPDGHWWCIWDLPHKEFTPAVEQALKAAFELGYRAHFMQSHNLMPVRFFNG